MAARLCLDCGAITTDTRCVTCTRARQPAPRQRRQYNRHRDARRGTTAQRGYGAAHQRAARKLKAAMQDGDPCCRCAQPMYRWQLALDRLDPRGIDADHHDEPIAHGGQLPDALAHRLCNRQAGGRTRRTE